MVKHEQHDERLRRWRLVLGGDESDGIKCSLSKDDSRIDAALAALYEGGGNGGKPGGKHGGTGASMPDVSRWLGDIRKYFPAPVVQVMQKEAINRVGLRQLLSSPEMMEMIQPDVHLVATLLSLRNVIPTTTRATARLVVKKVVDDLIKRLSNQTRQTITGALNRAIRNNRPRHKEIDWNRTIRANLKHYQQDYKTVIPEQLVGYGRKRASLKDIILCIDQSGSMGSSVVFSSIFGAVMASMPALKTSMVLFDTSIVDMTPELHDPVEVLFGVKLGGGTDIAQALAYCQQLVRRPHDTVMILITDLYEGGNREMMLKRAQQLVSAGVNVITLLALNDDGTPSYDSHNAAAFAEMGIPTFTCTPDLFPEMMAAALNRQDMAAWAARHNIKLAKSYR